MSEWRIRNMTGRSGTLSHAVIAIAPGCPDGRHPTRDCACQVFKTPADAETYIAEQKAVA
jgi:hypothetical protein